MQGAAGGGLDGVPGRVRQVAHGDLSTTEQLVKIIRVRDEVDDRIERILGQESQPPPARRQGRDRVLPATDLHSHRPGRE